LTREEGDDYIKFQEEKRTLEEIKEIIGWKTTKQMIN
jgi:hypothetical protein